MEDAKTVIKNCARGYSWKIRRKLNSKPDLDNEAGQHQASDSTTDTRASESALQPDSSDMLKESLHSELALVKSEICKEIEAEISVVTSTLKSEIAALKSENNTAISALIAEMDSQNQTLKEVA